MTDVESRLLAALAEAEPGFALSFSGLSSVEAAALRVLAERGLVEARADYPDGSVLHPVRLYIITDAGRLALEALQEARKQQAQQKSEADRKKSSDDAKALLDKKKDRRHDFKVAAFTVVLTLCLEHARDLLDLVQRALKALGLLP